MTGDVEHQQGLFRREALQASQDRWAGNVLVINPLSFSVLTALATGFVLVVLLFLFFGSFTSSQRVAGVLRPESGLSKVYGRQSGTVESVFVSEGDVVQAGDRLYTVRTDRVGQYGAVNQAISDNIEQSIDRLKQQVDDRRALNELKQQELANEKVRLDEEIDYLGRQIQAQQKLKAVLAEETEGMRRLVAADQLSRETYNAKHSEFLRARMRLAELRREQAALQFRRASLARETDELEKEAELAVASLQEQLRELQRRLFETDSRESYVVKAPIDGRVTALTAKRGASVGPDVPLLSIVPRDESLQAELYVPTRAIGFVETGQSVQLRYQAFPHEQFGFYEGTVEAVSETVLSPNDLPELGGLNEPVYRLTVSLAQQHARAYGKDYPLQPGMVLQADVAGREKTLVQWLLDPLYSVKGVL